LRHPEYLQGWIKILRADTRALFTAGAKASEAAEYLAKLAGRRGDEALEEPEAA
jgi:antirestriction protein ArdC